MMRVFKPDSGRLLTEIDSSGLKRAPDKHIFLGLLAMAA